MQQMPSDHHRSSNAIPLLDAAGLQALLDAVGHVGGDGGAEGVDILAVEEGVAAQGRGGDVGVEPEEGLGGLLHAGVLVAEGGHEDGRVAAGVELGVHGALGEDDGLELGGVVRDRGEAVLRDELGVERALDHDVELGGARVHVRGVEAAGADEADGHADAVADQGGEGLAVGFDGVAACGSYVLALRFCWVGRRTRLTIARCHGAFGSIVEVVQEVIGLQELVAISHGGGGKELCDQSLVIGARSGRVCRGCGIPLYSCEWLCYG